MADIFAAVDLTSVSAFVVAAGVVAVGIRMAFKGTVVAKEVVRKS